jgi:glycosyltransferase involved in cell wall biosynthesis
VTRPVVLLLITTFDMGGAERVYIQLAKGLSSCGYRVIAACLQGRSRIVERELEDAAVSLVDLAVTSKFDVRALFRLIRVIRQHHVEVVYTFLIHPHLIGRLAGRLTGVPVILSSQQTMLYEGQWLEWANRSTARWCRAVVAVSRNVENYLADQVKLPRSKLVTIYNSVDAQRLHPKPFPVRTDLAPVVGYCARLTPEKDHETLLHAIVSVKREHPDVRLLLAGEGPQRARLTRMVQHLDLGATVQFLGHVADVQSFYDALDVYVQSSFVEGLPCAVLEAMACALPVVATRVGGNEEIITHGESGVLVPPRDAASLAAAINWVTADPDRAVRMGERGRRVVEDRFSADAMVRATDMLITSLYQAALTR